MRGALAFFAAVSFCSVGILLAGTGQQEGLASGPGRPPAPPLDLVDSSGDRIRLSDFRGKALIVNFWATWCLPCRAEMPSMERAWHAVKDEGIGVIAVNVGDNPNSLSQLSMEHLLSFPLPMDQDFTVVKAWPVKGLPTTFVVDTEGRLAYQAMGERKWDDPTLLELVRALKIPPDSVTP
jgi:peroxiredoxin